MSRRRRSGIRRTPFQVAADARAGELAAALGRAIRGSRRRIGRTQAAVGDAAGVAQSTVSKMERGRGACVSLLAWCRVARGAGSDLRGYLDGESSADQPRDIVHLRSQELIVRTAVAGGWVAEPEAAIDADSHRSRSVDVLLRRARELAVLEAWDWLDDVGAAFRAWDRRLARAEAVAIARMHADALGPPLVCGCWVLRATGRNRRLVADHAAVFAARFPGSGSAWLTALNTTRPMPAAPALLWVTVRGDRLLAARLSTRRGTACVAAREAGAGTGQARADRPSPGPILPVVQTRGEAGT